jgi:hypothetical protein
MALSLGCALNPKKMNDFLAFKVIVIIMNNMCMEDKGLLEENFNLF